LVTTRNRAARVSERSYAKTLMTPCLAVFRFIIEPGSQYEPGIVIRKKKTGKPGLPVSSKKREIEN
jgi:hypothetical protein